MSHQNRVDFVGLNPHGRVKLWIYRLGEPPSIPSGYVKIAIEMALLIVDFPIENGDVP